MFYRIRILLGLILITIGCMLVYGLKRTRLILKFLQSLADKELETLKEIIKNAKENC